MPCAWVAKDSGQVGPIHGTGPGRFRRRARRIELAETLIPGFRTRSVGRTGQGQRAGTGRGEQ